MRLTSKLIAKKLKEARNDPTPRSAEAVLQNLLFLSLSEIQNNIYDFIQDFPGVSSMEIAEHYNMKQNYCGNQLKQLYELGLLDRTVMTDNGLYYTWRIK